MAHEPGRGRRERITSLQNDRIKSIRALEMRKERRETGLFVAEGAALIVTARDNGHVPVTIVRTDSGEDHAHGSRFVESVVDAALEQGADVLDVSPAVMGKLAQRDNPQMLLAVFRQRFAALPEPAHIAPGATWLALEAVRDPGNLGTIIRTADAAGASGIILAGQCCDPYSREAVRASMGSIFSVPIVQASEDDLRGLMRTWPADVIGTHLDATDDFRRVAYRHPSLLVMGSEGPGLSDETARCCTRLVRIPMAGRLDSLNLAVATALTLYRLRDEALPG